MSEFLPIAVWYGGGKTRATMVRHPGPGDREMWREDLKRIKECGFNSVKCWADWAACEPRPGIYRFDAPEMVMDLARELGLKVILQLYLDSAPDWLGTSYPDGRYVSAGGDAVHSQGSPGYCYDHPGIRRAAETFMRQLALRVKGREEFLAWDVWSEPHVVQWAYLDYLPQPATFCYCHYTIERFREWLKAKYDTIEALNEAWYRTFTSWDVVDAPRFVSLMTHADGVDWQRFIVEKLAADLAWRRETVKSVDPGHIVSSHNDIPCMFSLPLYGHGSPDDWAMAKSVDIWGTSLYPKHVGARDSNDPAYRSAELEQIRSACAAAGNPAFWLGELQAGHGYVGMFAVEATAKDESEWAWQSLGCGAKGLCFYAWHPMSTGYESAGFGMANLDGTPSDRALAAGAVSRIVTENMDFFLKAQPPRAEAAILYDVYSNIMWTIMREKSSYIPSRSLLGAHRPFYRENLPADYIHVAQIEAGALADYKVLYMPFAMMLPRGAAEKIKEFVEKGGIVMAEARTAWNDERGRCGSAVPGLGLEEVFGCREIGANGRPNISSLRPEDAVRITVSAPFGDLAPGDELLGYGLQEFMVLTAPSARVIAAFEDGRPAVVVNRFGDGLAVYAGTFLSFATETFRHPGDLKLLGSLPAMAGLARPILVEAEADPGEIEVRTLVDRAGTAEERQVLFVFNHAAAPVDVKLSVALSIDSAEALDLLQGGRIPVKTADGRALLGKRLEPGEIWIVRLAGR